MGKKSGTQGGNIGGSHHHRSKNTGVKKGQKKRQNKAGNAGGNAGGSGDPNALLSTAGNTENLPKWERKLQKKNNLKAQKKLQKIAGGANASGKIAPFDEVMNFAMNCSNSDNTGSGGLNISPPPKVVALVAFHDLANPYLLKRKCLALCGVKDAEDGSKIEPYTPYTVKLPDWAQPSRGGILYLICPHMR